MSGNHGVGPLPSKATAHAPVKRHRTDSDEDDGHVHARTKRTRSHDLSDLRSGPAADADTIRLSHDAYTVGWVCALHIEMAAAKAMLDRTHERLDMSPNDSNTYTFGQIGSHNVVIACLPSGKYGTNSAAVVANNMHWSFPSIQVRLMVGIGGGVPGQVDIRLGDVVVSNPTAASSGVVQYDFGKAVRDGQFERIGTFNTPPQLLLTAVSDLRSEHETRPSHIPSILKDMERRHPTMVEYFHQSVGQDRLFEAMYEHDGGTCDDCDSSKLVKRVARPDHHPKVHYGIIASGNQVMKHAQTRNRLARDLGILCFEMEAAGLMDTFPCLVIRGICDYSDSHKAKGWQKYAAATAAAYAKELLSVIPLCRSHQLLVQAESLSPSSTLQTDHRKALFQSLKFDQVYKRQTNIKDAQAKTCEWLLKHPAFTDWMDCGKYSQHHGFLWIRGKPGAGKSTIMKYIFARATRRATKKSAAISFFFNARGEGIEKTTIGLYRSLLYQLFTKMPDLQVVLDDMDPTPFVEQSSDLWDLGLLSSLFSNAISKLGQRRLTCFIDALDECAEHEVREMMAFFEDLGQCAVQTDTQFYACFSSRHYPHIDIQYGQRLILEDQVGHQEDLQEYVNNTLKSEKGPENDKIAAEVIRKASGVFMWVVLVVDILNKEYLRGRHFAMKRRLNEIPAKLGDLFKNILTRDNENMDDLLLCIQWLLYGSRALTRQEYYFALASGLEPESLGEWSQDDIMGDSMDLFVISSSKGVAETTKSDDKTVQFIHESVRDFLLKDNGLHEIWPDLGDDFEGKSHERLKNCCHLYTKVDISAVVPTDEFLLNVSQYTAAYLRTQAETRFPFLEYATNQVLFHSNAAAKTCLQDQFVQDFEVER